MGQKVNPVGFRLGINKTWESRWYSEKDFPRYLREDLSVRKFVNKKFLEAGVSKVDVERTAKQMTVKIHAARPGRIIGKQGKDIETLRQDITNLLEVTDWKVKVDVFEVKIPDTNAKLSSLNVAQQLEKRVSFRRAMKKVMQQAMKAGAKGIKVRVAGRLNGAEMARTERYMEGRVPLHTLRADIDYGFSEAHTTYGVIGVKVWVFKGEIYDNKVAMLKAPNQQAEE